MGWIELLLGRLGSFDINALAAFKSGYFPYLIKKVFSVFHRRKMGEKRGKKRAQHKEIN
jgi:hypothetical protein